jgi:hypothetical protein
MLPTENLKIAVVTGGHSFDVPNFHALFHNLSGIDAIIQHMDDFASSPVETRDRYDVILFYTMLLDTPVDEGLPWYAGKPKTALEHLGETQQGILMLHHSILAYPQWAPWQEMVGIHERSQGYQGGETVHIDIAKPQHVVTQGMKSWNMVDEIYLVAEPDANSQVLLTTNHPKSMKTIAWTRQYRNARVFCFESGHDNRTWTDANFLKILSRGINWAAGRI